VATSHRQGSENNNPGSKFQGATNPWRGPRGRAPDCSRMGDTNLTRLKKQFMNFVIKFRD